MQVLDVKTGCVISTTEAISDCPECGALRASMECEFCGWTEPTAEHQAAPVVVAPKPEPRRPDPDVHIDAGNDLICESCGGDREEIDGLLQCPVCGPAPGTEPPAKPRVAAAVNKTLPNIDDKLPADTRCPKCLEEAEAEVAAAHLAGRDITPMNIGERAIVVDYSRGGAIMLVCPVCNEEEELAPGKIKDEQPEVGESAITHDFRPGAYSAPPEKPPLEVKRRKKG